MYLKDFLTEIINTPYNKNLNIPYILKQLGDTFHFSLKKIESGPELLEEMKDYNEGKRNRYTENEREYKLFIHCLTAMLNDEIY